MTATATEVICKLPKPFGWQERLREIVAGDARFVVAVMGRRAGKTTALADIAGDVALDGGTVFWGAPTHDLASIGRETWLKYFRPACAHRTKIPPEATLYTGGRVLWRSFDREGSAIGRGNDLVVVDEAARVKKQIVYEEVLPTVAETRGKVVAITTPRGRHSWVFDWVQRARAGDPLYAVIHGPSTENPNPEVRDFVEIARENMPDSLFRQEIMAEFVEGEGVVFRGVIDCATESGWLDKPEPGRHYLVGCDLAKHQDYTVMYAIDADSGRVVACDRFNKIDWNLIEQRLRNFQHTWQAPIWLDSTGVGDPVFDRLAASGLAVAPIKFTSETKQNLVIALANAIEKREVSYPADPVLLGELEAFGYEQLPSGKFRYSAPDGMHDDCVIALALAVMGRHQQPRGEFGWVA